MELRLNKLTPKGIVFDFDGVFTDNKVYVDQRGHESVRCSRSDGLGLDFLRKLEISMVVISTEANPVVTARCKKLNIECFQNVSDKIAKAVSWANEHGYGLSELAFVGNDINDIPLMKAVGFKVCVSDAYPELKLHCDFTLKSLGGDGAVREVCEMINNAYKGM